MAKQTKASIMSGVEHVPGTARVVANNTVRYTRADGAECVRLHNTTIVERFPDGRTVLRDGGWKTVTTKARWNDYARPYRVYSNRGTWTVYESGTERSVPYFDGIELPAAFDAPKKAESAVERDKKTRKRVAAFINKTLPLGGTVPLPATGDCWLCRFGMDGDCLASHVQENYMHGSLIVRALRAAGMTDTGIAYFIRQPTDSLLRSRVRRFLNRSLGLVP